MTNGRVTAQAASPAPWPETGCVCSGVKEAPGAGVWEQPGPSQHPLQSALWPPLICFPPQSAPWSPGWSQASPDLGQWLAEGQGQHVRGFREPWVGPSHHVAFRTSCSLLVFTLQTQTQAPREEAHASSQPHARGGSVSVPSREQYFYFSTSRCQEGSCELTP